MSMSLSCSSDGNGEGLFADLGVTVQEEAGELDSSCPAITDIMVDVMAEGTTSDTAPPPPNYPRFEPALASENVDELLTTAVCGWLFDPVGGGVRLYIDLFTGQKRTSALAYGPASAVEAPRARAIAGGELCSAVLPDHARVEAVGGRVVDGTGETILTFARSPVHLPSEGAVGVALAGELGARLSLSLHAPTFALVGMLVGAHDINLDVPWVVLLRRAEIDKNRVVTGVLAEARRQAPDDPRLERKAVLEFLMGHAFVEGGLSRRTSRIPSVVALSRKASDPTLERRPSRSQSCRAQ
jgi:hypothetical protein